jgi:hypothetical protein
MSIKLLSASVDPVDPQQAPDVSTSLATLTQRAITTRAGQIRLVPSADAFARSSSTRQGAANRLNGTLVRDSSSDEAGPSGWEYVSGWAWNRLIESTAVAHYLSYAAAPVGWGGRLIDLYA